MSMEMNQSFLPDSNEVPLDYLSSPLEPGVFRSHSPPAHSDDPYVSSTSPEDSQLMAKTAKRKYYRKKTDKVQRWTLQECDLYEQFIDENLENYLGANDKSGKRNKKNFILMSTFISTKTPCQCRSHHQKFFKKTLGKILEGKANEQDLQYRLIQDSIKNILTQKKRIKKNKDDPTPSPQSVPSQAKSKAKSREEEPKRKRQSLAQDSYKQPFSQKQMLALQTHQYKQHKNQLTLYIQQQYQLQMQHRLMKSQAVDDMPTGFPLHKSSLPDDHYPQSFFLTYSQPDLAEHDPDNVSLISNKAPSDRLHEGHDFDLMSRPAVKTLARPLDSGSQLGIDQFVDLF